MAPRPPEFSGGHRPFVQRAQAVRPGRRHSL